jgi:hypothetical protein
VGEGVAVVPLKQQGSNRSLREAARKGLAPLEGRKNEWASPVAAVDAAGVPADENSFQLDATDP